MILESNQLSDKARRKEIEKYGNKIPYIKDKEIRLKKGRFNTGKISTNLLDSIYDASQRVGIPFEEALGLAGRESTLGIGRGFKEGTEISPTELMSNWQQVQDVVNTNSSIERYNDILKRYKNKESLNDEDIAFIRQYFKNEKREIDSTRPIEENPIDNALKYYKAGKYNKNDSKHTRMVKADGKTLMSEPAIQKYLLERENNKHDIGGFLSNIGSKLDGWNTNLTDKFLDSGIGKGLSSFGIKAGGLGGIVNTAATAIGGLTAGGRSSAVGNAMQKVGSLASNIPGVGGVIGAGVNLLGGVVNGAFGSKLNAENIAAVEGDINQALNFTSNAGDYDALASNYAGLQGVRGFNQDFIGKDGWIGGSKAKRKFNSLKEQAEEAEAHQLLALTNNAQNIADNNLQLLEANYNAYGGPLDMKYTGVMSPFGNQFKDGGIYIKTSKRGTFTAAAKKRGMGVQEFASKVLANKEDYSPAMVKKANFARNTSKWHDDGGPLGEKNLSLEDFITQKINEKRAAALDKSRNRTSVRVPMIPNPITEEEWKDSYIRLYRDNQESAIAARQSGNIELAEILEKRMQIYKNEYMNYSPTIPASNCMYNAGDCYGLNIPGNQTFAATHKEKGFKKVDSSNIEPGDIVQSINTYGIPVHAMIFDSKDKNGKPLYNYARGFYSGSFNKDYVKQGHYPMDTNALIYRYIGTPADSTQWINEYKEMKNKKADGGNLFTNGVTTIGNGGTHESNPYEGVQMGVDPQGIPNLVEEGEVIYDDYVFSNRIRDLTIL